MTVQQAQARYRQKNQARLAQWQRAYHDKDPRPHMLAVARNRAIKAGLEFSIEKDDIVVPEVCPVLDIKLERGHRVASDSSPSLDRINNDLGYVKGNIKVISWRANRLKADGSAEEHLLISRYIHSRGINP